MAQGDTDRHPDGRYVPPRGLRCPWLMLSCGWVKPGRLRALELHLSRRGGTSRRCWEEVQGEVRQQGQEFALGQSHRVRLSPLAREALRGQPGCGEVQGQESGLALRWHRGRDSQHEEQGQVLALPSHLLPSLCFVYDCLGVFLGKKAAVLVYLRLWELNPLLLFPGTRLGVFPQSVLSVRALGGARSPLSCP